MKLKKKLLVIVGICAAVIVGLVLLISSRDD